MELFHNAVRKEGWQPLSILIRDIKRTKTLDYLCFIPANRFLVDCECIEEFCLFNVV